MAESFAAIWDALRQDRGEEYLQKLLDAAPQEAFGRFSSRHRRVVPYGHLLGAALAYQCPTSILQSIAARTTDNSIYEDGLRGITEFRALQEDTRAVLRPLGFHEQGINYHDWLRLALLTEHRAWFWDDDVAGPFLKEQAKSEVFLKKITTVFLPNLPPICVATIRRVLDLPEGTE